MNTLADRVRVLLRQHAAPAPLSERDAVQRLRPYGQGVQGAPVLPPLNHEHPGQLSQAGGVRGEPLFDGVPDSRP